MTRKYANLSKYFFIVLAVILFSGMALPGRGSAGNDPGEISGWLNIAWGDPQGAGESQLHVSLLTPDGSEIALHLPEPLPLPYDQLAALAGKYVKVGGGMRLSDGSAGYWEITSIEAVGSGDLPENPPVLGSQPWITLLCKFSDYAAEPRTPSFFQGMYGSAYPGLDHYWREQSYNLMNVAGSGSVAHWYVLPNPRSYYVHDGAMDLNRGAQDCTAVADAAVNFSTYLGINMMFNFDLDGYAWGGSRWLTLDGANRRWYMTWEPPWGYADITVIEHEMGHGFGLPHSSGNYGQTYDNRWDVMSDTWTDCGNSRDPTYGCLGQHTIAYHKNIDGWISATRRDTISAGNQATITLEQLALPQTGNFLMAQIPIGGSATHFYTVEVRRKVGYDVKLPGQAVVIHEVDTTRNIPAHIVDIDGNGNTGDAAAMWLPGETFNDAANHISVQVLSATASGFVVTISNAFSGSTRTPTPSGVPGATPTRTASPTPSRTPIPPAGPNRQFLPVLRH